MIDVELSTVELLGTKAEVKLRKLEPISWASLELRPPIANTATADEEKCKDDE